MGKTEMEQDNVTFEAPYPLQSRFRKIILPGLLLATVCIGVVMGQGSSWLTQKIYLELAEKRSQIVNRALMDANPAVWEGLQVSTAPVAYFQTTQGQSLLDTLRDEVKELGLSHLKIYGKQGVLLYSSEEDQIGQLDPSSGYQQALDGVRSLVEKQLPDGTRLYELYVRVPDILNPIVMELYEPVQYLDAITMQIVVPAILIPVITLIILGTLMNKLVGQAQGDINYRTSLLAEFRERLQKLVSAEAVTSLRSATGKGEVASRRVRATILFSDIRGFTAYCEAEPPEKVVAFLNRSLGIVIDAVKAHGGDVDKMIGDAVLAHFQGENAERNAYLAARQAQEQMKTATLPRGIGIGIYSGDLVMGMVGITERMDFTVIGDTVNIASRLCSAAREGEIVIDQESALSLENEGLQAFEEISVKGKNRPLRVLRISA